MCGNSIFRLLDWFRGVPAKSHERQESPREREKAPRRSGTGFQGGLGGFQPAPHHRRAPGQRGPKACSGPGAAAGPQEEVQENPASNGDEVGLINKAES